MRYLKQFIVSRTLLAACVLAAVALPGAIAATTDLGSVPVAGTGQASPPPNVMLLMDTSASMGFTHMPDDLEPLTYDVPIGYRSSQCNSLYYNPAKTYTLPTKSDGTPRDTYQFAAAPYNVYLSIADTRNLGTEFRAYDKNTRALAIAGSAEDVAQPAYYYVFVPTSGASTLSYKMSPCTDSESVLFPNLDRSTTSPNVVTANTTGGQWKRIKVGASSGPSGADERQNFSNWYAYYRTRMLMVKSAMSTAFSQQITNKFRVGFVSMNPMIQKTNGLPDLTQGVDPAKYLQIDDFTNAAHRTDWFSKLTSQVANGSSPAREGLARVGRHFAGKMDGINLNMGPDPMGTDPAKNTCQQNFVIMTTDGYWNTIAETAGAVQLDGTTKVGQQDGNLTLSNVLDSKNPALYTHRPMWDGALSGTRTVRSRQEQSQYAPCDSGQYYKKTSIIRMSTSQLLQRTQSLTKTTDQYAVSTGQTSTSTSQTMKTTKTETRQTLQSLASTQQTTKSTRQERQTTTTYAQNSRTFSKTTTQNLQTNTWTELAKTTRQSLTVQYTSKQERITRTLAQTTVDTSRTTMSTSQLTKVDTTNFATVTQMLKSTSQTTKTTTQQRENTSQILYYNGATEQYSPVASCPGAASSCITLTTGPTPVDVCTPQTAAAGNSYLTRTCAAPVVVASLVAASSCSDAAASSANNHTSTTCNTVTTTDVPSPSCTAASASSGNSYLTTTCRTTQTGPTKVASCTASPNGSSYPLTSCSSSATAPVGVSSCTVGTNSTTLVTTSCPVATTGPTPVATCTASSAGGGNSYVATTCTPITTSTPIDTTKTTCTASGPTATNNYTTTTCGKPAANNTTGYAASCTPGTSGTFVVTTCSTETIQPTTGVAAKCTSVAATAANGWISTTCNNPSTTNWVTEAGCVAIPGTAANGYVDKQCRDNPTSGPTPVLPANCKAETVGAVTTTCTPRSNGPTPVASCVANTTGPTFVACSVVTTPPVVGACTAGSSGAPNYIVTTCTPINGPATNVPVCTPQAAGPGNNYTETVCATTTNTVAVPPGTCVAQSPTAGNNNTTITCPAAITTGPVGVPFNSCTPVAASLANGWIATTCANIGPTTPTPVASCTNTPQSAGNNYVTTTCSTNNSAVTAVTPGSCTNAAAASGNQFTQTICTPTTSTVPVQAGTCTGQTPSSTNGYTSVSCNTANTGPTFVALDSCTPGTDGNFLTTTCSTVRTGPTLVASCTPGSVTDGSEKVTTCTDNKTGPIALAVGSVCKTEAASSANNWTSTTCTAVNEEHGVSSCTPSAPGALTIVSCRTSSTPLTPVAACTGGTDSNFLSTSCDTSQTTTEIVTSCTPVPANAGNGYQSVTCESIPGLKVQTRTRTTDTTSLVSGSTPVGNPTIGVPVDSSWTDNAGGVCYAPPQSPPAIDTSWHTATSTADLPAGCTDWSACTLSTDTSTSTSGSTNSLADVAQYYYVTDLRPEKKDEVRKIGDQIQDDRAPWQHMTTFVVGLGVDGTLQYQSDYKTSQSGDFFHIRTYGDPLNWPNWPDPKVAITNDDQYNDPRSIDDFWHAAVNGRGQYFSAKDPDSVAQGLKDAFAAIDGQQGAGAGAATSSLTPVAGDNVAYTGSFTTSDWTGNLQAQEIDLTTGNLSSTIKWTAAPLLDAKTGAQCDNRTIYARDPATGALINFAWNTYACNSAYLPGGAVGNGLTPALKSYFSGSTLFTDAPALSQLGSMSADQLAAAKGANLVNFLRGQRGYENFAPGNVNQLYRARKHVLGDIVNSQPTYVKAPSLTYQDTGYDTFKTTNANRTPMVYVGANDGMLHAFYAPAVDTDPNYALAGQEAWAFVPNAVMSNLWRLADASYPDRHVFSVDGSPTAGDVYDSSAAQWKTIVVGGLNKGGNGYYALDVTNPTAPKPLWEFNSTSACGTPVGASADCNLGLTYGSPVITKLANKKWVVMFTSGYNNVTTGDGGGYLYVVDAITGKIISRIATGVGNTGTPSGLKDINYFVANAAYDNTALRVYGADVLGNIWRFDVNDTIDPTGLEATLLGTAKDESGHAQPITTRPELAEVSGSTMVIVGTGKLLAASDLTDQSTQSIYAFKDPMNPTGPAYVDFRKSLNRMELVQTGSFPTATRTTSCPASTATDCSSTNGWFMDLPDAGERVNINMQTVLGTLVFGTNVPNNSTCTAGGYSWLNYVNLINGQPIPVNGEPIVSVPFFGNSVVVGLGLVGLGDGTVRALGRDATGLTSSFKVPVGSPPALGKRISWREIVQ